MRLGSAASSSQESSFATATQNTPSMASSVDYDSEIALLSVETAVQQTLEQPEELDFWDRMSCATAEQPDSECSTAVDDLSSVCTAFENCSVETAINGYGDAESSWTVDLSENGIRESGSDSYLSLCSLTSEESVMTAVSRGTGPLVYAVKACPMETIDVVWRNHDQYMAMKDQELENDDDDTVDVTFGEVHGDEEEYFAPAEDCPSVDSMLCNDRKSQRPVSYYQLGELNKGAVDYAPRLVNVSSQYHANGMEDFHAFDSSPSTIAISGAECHGDVNQQYVDSFYFAEENLVEHH